MNTLYKQNGMVAWPDGWDGQNYNGTNEPCDMLVGPCSCGAWHHEDEYWVRRALEVHNAIIRGSTNYATVLSEMQDPT